MTVPPHPRTPYQITHPRLHTTTLLIHPYDLCHFSLETGYRVGSFVDHNCAEDITGDIKKPGTDKKYEPHAMSAPALAPALQELVSADPTVKPKALVAQLGRYVLQTPSATFASKVKQVCEPRPLLRTNESQRDQSCGHGHAPRVRGGGICNTP